MSVAEEAGVDKKADGVLKKDCCTMPVPIWQCFRDRADADA